MRDIPELIEGFFRFQQNYFSGEAELFKRLKKGQSPKSLVISCCDSRVDPALLMDCEPGDLFVVRNVANLVPPYEPDRHCHGVSAALEYAVCQLGVEHVIVLGHSCCGGIKALMDGEEKLESEFIGNWVGIAESAKKATLERLGHKSSQVQCRACEQASILVSLENLLSFPFVQNVVDKGKLALHGWYFDIESGKLFSYHPDSKHFDEIS